MLKPPPWFRDIMAGQELASVKEYLMNRARAVALIFSLSVALVIANQSADAQKQITDPAEYHTYMAALNEPDQAKKAALMEAFVQQYPQSVVKADALEQAMAAYQQVGNSAKVEVIAKRILEFTPDNVRAVAIVVYLDRAKATQGDPEALKDVCTYARAGLRLVSNWQKPEGMTDADSAKLQNQMAAIFNGGAGFCALQAKDYSAARDAFTKVFVLDPASLQDVYQLAISDLERSPIEVNGFWYCAKAINLARNTNDSRTENAIAVYCKAKYKRYHGSNDGWDAFVSDAAGAKVLPTEIGIKAAPTPAELAVQAVQQNAPEDLSFSDKEFILGFRDASPANTDAADKVWASIQAMQKNGEARLEIPVKIISASEGSIDAAISDDNRAANKADLHVIMEKPMLNPPPANAEIKIIGVITRYTPQPFMFTMEHGELPASKGR